MSDWNLDALEQVYRDRARFGALCGPLTTDDARSVLVLISLVRRAQEDTLAFEQAMVQSARHARMVEKDIARVQAENSRLVDARREAEATLASLTEHHAATERSWLALRTERDQLVFARDAVVAMLEEAHAVAEDADKRWFEERDARTRAETARDECAAERDELYQRVWRAEGQLTVRYALRREIEALLGVADGPASDEQLQAGVEAARALVAERDALKARVVDLEIEVAAWCSGTITL